MENKLMVSVDMITYKHEAFIAQAIEGVLMQETNFEYDLIIADDCSPDNTEAIVRNIIATHPKGHIIKYFRHKKNIGMQPNGIFAEQQCTGKYIAICEGDDYWTDPLKLQKQVDFLEANEEYSLCAHAVNVVDDNNEYKYTFSKPGTHSRLDVMTNYSISTLSVLFNKKYLDLPKWYYDLKTGDYGLFMILLQDKKAYVMPDIMGVHIDHEGGVWSLKSTLNKAEISLFNFEILINNLIWNTEEFAFLNKTIYDLKKYIMLNTRPFYHLIKKEVTFYDVFQDNTNRLKSNLLKYKFIQKCNTFAKQLINANQ